MSLGGARGKSVLEEKKLDNKDKNWRTRLKSWEVEEKKKFVEWERKSFEIFTPNVKKEKKTNYEENGNLKNKKWTYYSQTHKENEEEKDEEKKRGRKIKQ